MVSYNVFGNKSVESAPHCHSKVRACCCNDRGGLGKLACGTLLTSEAFLGMVKKEAGDGSTEQAGIRWRFLAFSNCLSRRRWSICIQRWIKSFREVGISTLASSSLMASDRPRWNWKCFNEFSWTHIISVLQQCEPRLDLWVYFATKATVLVLQHPMAK